MIGICFIATKLIINQLERSPIPCWWNLLWIMFFEPLFRSEVQPVYNNLSFTDFKTYTYILLHGPGIRGYRHGTSHNLITKTPVLALWTGLANFNRQFFCSLPDDKPFKITIRIHCLYSHFNFNSQLQLAAKRPSLRRRSIFQLFPEKNHHGLSKCVCLFWY